MYPGNSTAHCTYCMFTDISTVLTALPILSQALSHGKMAVVMTKKHGQKLGLKDLACDEGHRLKDKHVGHD